MSELSPNLSLPLIQAAQAQKHVTHNEAVELLDMIVQLTVQAFDATTPPGQAGEGQAWALGAAPTGVWASQGGQIASWRGGGWIFAAPQIGWQAWGVAEAALRVYTGNGWQDVAPETVLQNLSGVGVNTTSDAINKFAVAADATLLSHDGAGHQLKLNKANASDTASLLYQTNWSGRAEMGLAGNDDFSIKVSPDGSTFNDAIVVDKDDGKVSFPSGTNGSGSAAGVMGLQVMAFTCERNSGFSLNSYLAFGNGAVQPSGAAMPFSGKVIAATLAQTGAVAGVNTLTMAVNRVASSNHSVSMVSTGAAAESAIADFSSAPLTFTAGDMLAMKITDSTDNGNTTVGTFFVVFD